MAACWRAAAWLLMPALLGTAGRAAAQTPEGVTSRAAKRGQALRAADAIILPARLIGQDDVSPDWRRRLAGLDALLADTAQDLDLLVDVGEVQPESGILEADLVAFAAEHESVSILLLLTPGPRAGDPLQMRMVAAGPGSKVMQVRLARVRQKDLAVRAVAMLRDVALASRGTIPQSGYRAPVGGRLATPATSHGRAILATNGTLYGGFVGYSMLRASESDDPRLLYPMIAVGAGIGLGAGIIISDEWNVGVGDAWYLAAGAWWPAVSAHLIYGGRFGETASASEDEPWAFGMAGSVVGLTLASVGLLPGGMGDGGAVMAHSGGALGVLLGGLTEVAVSGDSDATPLAGMGYGAAAGWLVASAAAVLHHPDPSDVLTADLGALLGGLAGASAASPLLFGEPTPAKTRGWVAATGAGLLAGGAIAWWWFREQDEVARLPAARSHARARYRLGLPVPAVIETRATPGEIRAPGFGASLSGQLW